MSDYDTWLATDTARDAETTRYEAWVESLTVTMPDGWFDTVEAEEAYAAWCEDQRAEEDAIERAFYEGPTDDQIRADEMEVEG